MFKVNIQSREIYIYDDIGPEWMGMIDSGTVIAALEQLGASQPISVRINSPGGDVQEGLAIFNALARHPGEINTFADSVAASCGSYIFAAGRRRVVAENAIIMIHDPWGMSMGNAAEHRKTADVYDKFAAAMARDYAKSIGIDDAAARQIMLDETWYTADEAVAAGVASEIGSQVADDPSVAKGRFAKAPEKLAAKVEAGSRTLFTVQHLRLKNNLTVCRSSDTK